MPVSPKLLRDLDDMRLRWSEDLATLSMLHKGLAATSSRTGEIALAMIARGLTAAHTGLTTLIHQLREK